MNNQGSWRNAYHQTLQKLKPAGVSAQTWKVFVDSVLMALVTANADCEILSPGLMEILDAEYVEPEEFAYQGIILGLKLLTTEQAQAEEVNDVLRRSFAQVSQKTAIDLWGYIMGALSAFPDQGQAGRQAITLSIIAPPEAARLANELSGLWED